VKDHRAVNQSCQCHCKRRRHASCLPQSPKWPDQAGVDYSLKDCGCQPDREVKHPERRFEDLNSEECPWVQGAHEPEADFRGCEQDADEAKGESDDPTAVLELASRSMGVDIRIELTCQRAFLALPPQSTRCRLRRSSRS
jgi:hypothetical protein